MYGIIKNVTKIQTAKPITYIISTQYQKSVSKPSEKTTETENHDLEHVHLIESNVKLGYLPTRSQQLDLLQRELFDVLIIGGGATGAGCALDAVTRGLRTAVVEMGDFSSGTSSRSTKLIHGGVRYLQDAVMKLDREQFKMVIEALNERKWMLKFAPHLTSVVPILIPVKKYWQLPYFWMGVKMYDMVAFGKALKRSYVISKSKTLEYFPMLRSDQIVGSIVYHDGQMDDARMNIGIIMTAVKCGATVANYVKVLKLVHDKEGILMGAYVRDQFTKKKWLVNAKCVINATGPFTDSIRKMDNSSEKNICSPSSGVHIILPGYITPGNKGLLDPNTSDGRVIFLLPWQKHTLVGTTDVPCQVTVNPQPTEAEINFILKEINSYFKADCEVRRSDVLSAWSGIRPLISDPNKKGTKSLARNHIIHVSPSKLITIAGGKWTTFRSMAEQTIDRAIKVCNLSPSTGCQTKYMILDGAQRWSPTMYIQLVQDHGISPDVAIHLSETYGCNAFEVIKFAAVTGKHWPILGRKLHDDFPYIEAEVRYGVREYACTAIDVIARRMRLSFLNVQVADEIAKKIVEIMANELYWCIEEKDRQLRDCFKFLRLEMGLCTRKQIPRSPIDLSVSDVENYIQRFKQLDFCKIGYINVNDLRTVIGNTSEHNIIRFDMIVHKMDMKTNPNINLDEYLQIMSQLKSQEVESSSEYPFRSDYDMKNQP